ncbi:DUF397 domain-containing protein [Streptomyces sp. NPDC086549]|uniref:DUF397 domain-containing protein n=1 Tax=Streptomyces sp. NPDC086549 TaxID=3365752 RepID=UPI0038220628
MITTPGWQRSSFCGEGESCIHVATTPESMRITESADPTNSILTTTPTAFAALLRTLRTESPHA